jgi:hypothetical protein
MPLGAQRNVNRDFRFGFLSNPNSLTAVLVKLELRLIRAF